MRRQINPKLLVNHWSPQKNKRFSKRGKKPKITDPDNSFSNFIRQYVENSPLLLQAIAQDMGISMSSLGNYLYKGKNPNYFNLMLIVHHISKHTEKTPGEILEFLYSNWSSSYEK